MSHQDNIASGSREDGIHCCAYAVHDLSTAFPPLPSRLVDAREGAGYRSIEPCVDPAATCLPEVVDHRERGGVQELCSL